MESATHVIVQLTNASFLGSRIRNQIMAERLTTLIRSAKWAASVPKSQLACKTSCQKTPLRDTSRSAPLSSSRCHAEHRLRAARQQSSWLRTDNDHGDFKVTRADKIEDINNRPGLLLADAERCQSNIESMPRRVLNSSTLFGIARWMNARVRLP